MSDIPARSAPDRVLVELTIGAPAETVWNAMRDPVQINRWFGWDADTLADEIRFIFIDNGRADDERMVLGFEGMSDRFEVEPRGAECVVRLIRAGAAGDDSDWDGVYEDVTEGWLAFLTQLRFALERHPGEDRRTIYLTGVPAAADGVSFPRTRLGLDALQDLAPGERYSVATPVDEALSGTVWRRSRRQLALTVDAWGDGLLLLTDRAPGERAPGGGGSATLTTYGMDDAGFEALSDRWTQWWQQTFPAPVKPSAADAPC